MNREEAYRKLIDDMMDSVWSLEESEFLERGVKGEEKMVEYKGFKKRLTLIDTGLYLASTNE